MDVLYGGDCGKHNAQRLEHLQNQAMQIFMHWKCVQSRLYCHLGMVSFLLVVNIVFWTFG